MRLERREVWGRAAPSRAAEDGTTRVAVEVTFLRHEVQPAPAHVTWPVGTVLGRVAKPTVGFYRYLYNTVGDHYVWWLRRTMADADLAGLLGAPGVSLHVLVQGNEPAGFYELDARQGDTVNISYFGLLPHAVGRGLGVKLLRAAVDGAWAHKPRALTVNTCTADHRRALPNYLAAGFFPVRTSQEVWDVPNRLGLVIPERLKVR